MLNAGGKVSDIADTDTYMSASKQSIKHDLSELALFSLSRSATKHWLNSFERYIKDRRHTFFLISDFRFINVVARRLKSLSTVVPRDYICSTIVVYMNGAGHFCVTILMLFCGLNTYTANTKTMHTDRFGNLTGNVICTQVI